MRARLVEDINFERGQDPQKSMRIGMDAVWDERIQDLKDEYDIKFMSESSHPYWRDHRSNVLRILQAAFKDDQFEMFEYVLDYQQENYPETTIEPFGKIMAEAAAEDKEEYVFVLLRAGIMPHDLNVNYLADIGDFLWRVLKEKLDNEG